MKKILLISGVSAILCLLSCTFNKHELKEVSNYTVTTPIKKDTALNKEYVAQIKAVRNIEIRTQEKGYLQNIYVDEGQFVKAGQLLFKIMPKMYEAEFLKAKSEVKATEIELQNTKLLADKNVVSKNELAIAQARLEKVKAEMSLAGLHLSFTEIRAPFDGYIDKITLRLGSFVDEGELLTSLSDNNDVYAYYNVSEPEYIDFKTNAKELKSINLHLLLANNQLYKYPGHVQTIYSEFDNETGTITFRAKFENPEKLLKHGETGKVQMTVPIQDAIIIPQKATYEVQDKTYVYLVDKNHTVRAKNITIAAELPDLYVVNSGIKESDKILLNGLQKVKEGDKIKYEFVAADEVLAHLKLKAE